ncbi:MAG: type II toxin-antitoxin system VapC family toxin [Clostridia bacterium]|nr:type II toxin-antitoxin system VapC family toxin [Clostridia bacterium]
MNCLLDTHILIWALTDHPALSAKARDLILDPSNAVYISVLSLWEIELKHTLRPTEIPFGAQTIWGFCKDAGFELLALKKESVFRLSSLSRREGAPPHKDPFDRMLICQSVSEGMTLLTRDSKFTDYGLNNIVIV